MLAAQIVEKSALRYSPAGLPLLDVSLRHESAAEQQLGAVRKLAFEIRARAAGPLAAPLLAAELGTEHEFSGFLGAQRNGRGVVFHIQSIEIRKGSHHAPAPR